MTTPATDMLTSVPPAALPQARPAPSRRAATLAELLGLDLRSLAVFRVGLGLLLLADLSVRAGDLEAFYTDAGVLPTAAVPNPWALSAHVLSGSFAFQAVLFALAAAFAAALLVGYRTGLATFASWFLLVSLHARNPVVLQGGDILFRLLLFWGIFLPLGERFSVDAWRRREPGPRPVTAFSGATAALILQMCFVYWFGVALKSDPMWWRDGTAVYCALSLDQLATPLGQYLLNFPGLLQVFTFATLALEAVGPALLFVPFRNGPVRTLVVAAFLLFHLAALQSCLVLGPFPYVCAVGWLALLPGWFWERSFVISAGRWLGRWLPAAGNIAEAKEGPPAVLGAPRLMNVLSLALLAYVFLWNVRTVAPDRFAGLTPRQAELPAYMFCLDQKWGMFAPFPSTEDGWYVIEGELEDGRTVDLFRGGGPVRWDKPARVAADYPNERWRKYLMNLWLKEHEAHRPRFAAYLESKWNASHGVGEQLRAVRIYYMLEMTRPNQPPAPVEKVLLWEHPPPDAEAMPPPLP
ncbi:MAG TPA: HTTM domain-containing protein [Gemmataceae bacterium]|nr:HTTM domain-containing protein [Gemmataceae bacterium]